MGSSWNRARTDKRGRDFGLAGGGRELKEGRRDTSAMLYLQVFAAAGTYGHTSQGVLVDLQTSQSQNTRVK